MKAKLYTLILSALMLGGMPAEAQFTDNRNFRNDDAGIVINNYYDDYDYYYSSRINRFHRSYAAFNYYSPVFTETYWYSWQPDSWGVSIYGRSGLGFGFAMNYPVYYYGWGTDYWYDYSYGWYDPYYGTSWYFGYDPFYYGWYSPVVVNINLGPRWGNRYWHDNHFRYNDFRPVYYTTNNYYHNSSTRNSYRQMTGRERQGEYYRSTGTSSRRESVPVSAGSNKPSDRSSEGQVNINEGRRTVPDNVNRGNQGGNASYRNNSNNANNGNNQNSRPEGNNGNFDRNYRNTNNRGNNNNSRPEGNNGNFGDKGAERKATTAPASTRPPAPVRTQPEYRAPSGRTSSQRSETTVSQGRSSSSGTTARSSGSSSRSNSSSTSRSSGSSSKSEDRKSSNSRK